MALHKVLVLSALAALLPACAEVCDVTCQQSQREALQLLYSSTKGSRWQNQQGWTLNACGSECGSWPQHCSWTGVHCCLPAGVLGPGTPHFPSNAAINCTSVGGITAILLRGTNLQGTLPEEVFAPLAVSMKMLDLSGRTCRAITGACTRCPSKCALQTCCLQATIYTGPSQTALALDPSWLSCMWQTTA